MAKAELKTGATDADVAAFIAAVPDPRRRGEAQVIDALHRRVTGCAPRVWGPTIVGYGSYHYRYASGREGLACRAGFSPRKPALTIYLMGRYGDRQGEADALFDGSANTPPGSPACTSSASITSTWRRSRP